jgi:hypothetical protein
MDSKQAKRIAIVEASGELAGSVLRFVEDKYKLEFTNSTDADYVIHSCHGYDVLKYSGVRIFISGENVSPNFAICDYAMTFEKLQFLDRYTWLPLIKLYRESYAALRSSRPNAEKIASEKTDFCAYVMSNTTNSADERSQIFELLSKYKTVNSGGRWRNNVGGSIPDKIAFQSKHKFVIAFENCSHPGYLTEKFADAAASNAIPIYWGDPDIASIFNSKSFINCHDFQTFEDVVDRVREIDTDNKLYHEILSEPWFVNETEPKCLSDSHFSDFLSNIFDQPHESAYRRNLGRWGIKKERQLYEMWAKPHIHYLKTLKRHWRNFRKSSWAEK